mmetsp:Transcript_95024/g.307473  ORF Transcript_95024/g.307473 Transcript_95024/m.307473 type:complete len:302 (+) Transcript_95024:3736-4641(+)
MTFFMRSQRTRSGESAGITNLEKMRVTNHIDCLSDASAVPAPLRFFLCWSFTSSSNLGMISRSSGSLTRSPTSALLSNSKIRYAQRNSCSWPNEWLNATASNCAISAAPTPSPSSSSSRNFFPIRLSFRCLRPSAPTVRNNQPHTLKLRLWATLISPSLSDWCLTSWPMSKRFCCCCWSPMFAALRQNQKPLDARRLASVPRGSAPPSDAPPPSENCLCRWPASEKSSSIAFSVMLPWPLLAADVRNSSAIYSASICNSACIWDLLTASRTSFCISSWLMMHLSKFSVNRSRESSPKTFGL